MKNLKGILIVLAFASVSACKDNDSDSTPDIYTFKTTTNWVCSANHCQDVWEVYLLEGTKASFSISDLTDGSIGQIALYGPNVTLGGTNLFTGTNNELSCSPEGCKNGAAGVSAEYTATVTGTYKFAATRNRGRSCGFEGNYTLKIISNSKKPKQILDNVTTSAPEAAICK